MVAHRAGNDLTALSRAHRSPVRLVEADIHLYFSRLEVRHLKTVGPLPIFWDRWELASPFAPRLLLDRLLAATPPGVELMLDLKGRDRRLARGVLQALESHRGRPITVCSRGWSLLEALRGTPDVRLVHSVGSRGQLRALRRRFEGRRLDGISIHRKLLDPETVADLRERADMIMTWPIASADEARMLGAWGVDGVISEDFERLARELAEAPADAPAGAPAGTRADRPA